MSVRATVCAALPCALTTLTTSNPVVAYLMLATAVALLLRVLGASTLLSNRKK